MQAAVKIKTALANRPAVTFRMCKRTVKMSKRLNSLHIYESIRSSNEEDSLRMILMEAAIMEDEACEISNSMITALRTMLEYGLEDYLLSEMFKQAEQISNIRTILLECYRNSLNMKSGPLLRSGLSELRLQSIRQQLGFKRSAFKRTRQVKH